MRPGKLLEKCRVAALSWVPMGDSHNSQVDEILGQVEQGDAAAADRLLTIVYDELRRLAAVMLASEKPGQTLQPTALVHEAYLKLVARPEVGGQKSEVREQEPGDTKPRGGCGSPQVDIGGGGCGSPEAYHSEAAIPAAPQNSRWRSRTHFFAAAAEAMRRILVDRARRKSAEKHGGKLERQELLDSDVAAVAPDAEVIAVNDALDALAVHDSLTAELIKLHYFGGFSIEEAGELLGMSRATAFRSRNYGRAWLRAELDDRDGDA